MSYLNDNNLDDLFKRASDKYPLRTDSADWNRLAGDLDRDPSLILPPAKEGGDNRRRRRFLWLLLLLPLIGISYLVLQQGSHHGNNSSINAGANSAGGKGTGTTGAAVLKNGDGTTSAQTGGKTNDLTEEPAMNQTEKDQPGSKPTDKPVTNPTDGVVSNHAGAAVENSTSVQAGRRGTNSAGPGVRGGNPEVSGGNPGSSGGFSGVSGRNPGMSKTHPGMSETNEGTSTSGNEGTSTSGNNAGTVSSGQRNGSVIWTPRDAEGRLVSLKTVPTSGGISLNIPAPARNKNIQATDTTKPKTKKQKDKQPSMYIGIVAAPDLSTVKFQSIKGTGVTAGILLGYNLNRRLALETGIYYDRKKYYSDGEYFNTKGMHLPIGSSLLNADGSCNMFEIPVNLRYNLNAGPKMKWFATAGLSTYFMKRESYSYNYSYSTWSGPGFYAYPSHAQYWFSIVNLSVGFEQKLGRVGQLRLEPYWRIPTRGMGTGGLPIMSAGLNIGITHKLW
jgi:outer membrane protein with beta-barrel domain